MMVTDIWDDLCWWVTNGDNIKKLVTDVSLWKFHIQNATIDYVTYWLPLTLNTP